MRKLVCGALALSAATGPGFASETDWLSLDSELEALSANLADGGEASFGGYIVTSFNYHDDAVSSDANEAYFKVNKARIHAKKKWDNGYSVKVQGDFASSSDGTVSDGDDATEDPSFSGGFGTFKIKDAYVRFPAGDLHGQIGNFKNPFLRSGLVSSAKLFFLTRTVSGEVWGQRDTGFMLDGNFDKLDWAVAAMNAEAGDTSFRYTGRVGFQVTGEDLNDWEGAYGYDSGSPSVYLAVSYVDDDGSFDGTDPSLSHNAFGFEGHAVTNTYSVSFESVSYSDGGLAGYGTLDNSPLAVTGTYMLTPETWELGVRYDDFDDTDNSNQITVGANHYLNGHALKWTYQYEMISSDDNDLEDSAFRIGLIASF